MESWYQEMESSLQGLASSKGFRWEIRPANSPWRQGKTERRIGVVKRLLKSSVNDVKLTTMELQLFLFEATNITSSRPISVEKRIPADGSYNILTPNDLILGRAIGTRAEDDGNMDTSSKSACAQLVQDVADHFWKRWAAEVTPTPVIRQQWHAQQRNLKVGDIVLVHNSSKLRNKYKLAILTEVHVSQDGLVRSCTVGFRQSRSPTKNMKYRSVWQSLQRSVQRLTLLLPVEEQEESLEVTNGVVARVQNRD